MELAQALDLANEYGVDLLAVTMLAAEIEKGCGGVPVTCEDEQTMAEAASSLRLCLGEERASQLLDRLVALALK